MENYEKKYKEALENAGEIIRNKDASSVWKDWLRNIFPELKESEDEKTRKELVAFLEELSKLGKNTNFDRWKTSDCANWIAWLEKQGEHKAEPKFHEGDWVVYKYDICQIVKREEGCNKLVTNFGIEKELVNERNLSTARLWTIQDAKDGDVLFDGSNILLVKEVNHWHNVASYLAYSQVYGIREYFISGSDVITPATKEQRDLLFQKMKESGYEWNAENKEVKKISQRIISAEAKEAMYDKPAWSEEDEEHYNACLNYFEEIKPDSVYYKDYLWLKSLKERIKQ